MSSKTQIDNPVLTCGHCKEYDRVSRREFLAGSLSSAAALAFGNSIVALPAWMPSIRLADPHVGPRGDTLVCIFLRGGADGLNMVVPHGDDDYYGGRPALAIPRPDDNGANMRTIDLDGFFGLHPALEPLSLIYKSGDLAFVQATGSPDETRSHFEAMALMERGAAVTDYSGWLARHLASLNTGNDSALRAIGVGDMLPASLTGALSATALQSIADYHLRARDERAGDIQAILQALYSSRDELLSITAGQTFAAIEALDKVSATDYQPGGRLYPEQQFGMALRTVAQLIKADVGLEAACIDLGGWDTHVAQGVTQGLMANLMSELALGLAAFYEDLAAEMDSVTLVVMSEFGRRVQENGGLGTDHGHGNMMMILGGGVNGGQVFSRWPGLNEEVLVGPGDLAITIDFRDVLGELIRKRLNNPRLKDVFPGYEVNEIGLATGRSV